MLLALMDITERKRAETRLAFMAQHDGLTGLPNRNLLRQQMDEMLAAHPAQRARRSRCCVSASTISRRSTTRSATASATSCCAASPSACARRCARKIRWPGSTPTNSPIIQSGHRRGPRTSRCWRKRLLDAIGEPYLLDGHSVVIGASIGIAMAPGDGDDSEKLLKNADMALSRAKNDSRGTLQLLRTRDGRPRPGAPQDRDRSARRRSRTTCCGRITSRWSISRPAASPASRRWCAGRIRSAA